MKTFDTLKCEVRSKAKGFLQKGTFPCRHFASRDTVRTSSQQIYIVGNGQAVIPHVNTINTLERDLLQAATTVVSFSIMVVAFVVGMRYGLEHRMEEDIRHLACSWDSGAAHLVT